jgi:hypothetical protein
MKQTLHTMVAALVALGACAMANAIEEPKYELLERLGKVEIRHYQPTVQAVTELNSNAKTSSGFRTLAGYIFGGNAREEAIAMTAPVQETLGVASPEMAFTMPGDYDLATLPEPNDPGVNLVSVPERTLAVITFSGWATAGKIEKYRDRLEATLRNHQLEAVGPAMLNQYNPPWTPPFLRRNEVVLEIKAE